MAVDGQIVLYAPPVVLGEAPLSGRYRKVRDLGRGAMGQVWLADDEMLGRQVAIKHLRRDLMGALDDDSIERITREARVAARLSHPHIVAVHDLIIEAGQPYVVMEFVDGESMAELIKRRGKLPQAEAAALVSDIADALDSAHRVGVVHRDVKPANILIDRRGRARLTDFGIARGLGDAALTQSGQILGTVAFMAPEAARSGENTPASDMYSLGATMYAALEGHAPYANGPANQTTGAMLVRLLTEPIPAPMGAGAATDVVLALLASEPSQRPTAADAAARLRSIASKLAEDLPAQANLAPEVTSREHQATSPTEETVLRSQLRSQSSSVPQSSLTPPAEPPGLESPPELTQIRANETSPGEGSDSTPPPTESGPSDVVSARPHSEGRRWSRRTRVVVAAAVTALLVAGGVVIAVVLPTKPKPHVAVPLTFYQSQYSRIEYPCSVQYSVLNAALSDFYVSANIENSSGVTNAIRSAIETCSSADKSLVAAQWPMKVSADIRTAVKSDQAYMSILKVYRGDNFYQTQAYGSAEAAAFNTVSHALGLGSNT